MGQALRAGRPQVVVPHCGDQFDNSLRLQAAGIGTTLRRGFDGRDAAAAISRALTNATMADAARRAAANVGREDGASEAARQIAGLHG